MNKMKVKKILSIAAISSGIFLFGCDDTNYSAYHINEKIGEDQVHFYESLGCNYLIVTKADGTIITYGDTTNEDLKIEYVHVQTTKDDITSSENFRLENELEAPVVRKAQEKFDDYLNKIIEFRKSKGYEALE